jgi:phosphatidylcholine synthase
MDERFPTPVGPRVAWGIHVFTATGALCGMFGLIAINDNEPKAALLWLMAALVIDGIDGPIARRCQVKAALPKVDGYVLDLVIDFFTCVIVPALFIYNFHLLPDPVAVPAMAAIVLTSLFAFSRSDIQTDDNYFEGFPAMWNLVANTFFLVSTPRMVNVVVVVGLCALTLSSVKFPHPVRVSNNRAVTLPITIAWFGTMTGLTIIYPTSVWWAQAVLLLALAYFALLSVRRTLSDTQNVAPAF